LLDVSNFQLSPPELEQLSWVSETTIYGEGVKMEMTGIFVLFEIVKCWASRPGWEKDICGHKMIATATFVKNDSLEGIFLSLCNIFIETIQWF
jgi:hypothetical protein